MISYTQALQHHDSIKKPPRAKFWTQGCGSRDNGKPLRRTPEDHMGIYRTADDVIYYKLYETIVATFYPPEADGSYKITTKYVPTQTTTAFMQEYNLHFSCLTTDKGESVRVPYVQHGGWRDNDKTTATLYFNAEHALIKERSSHQDVYTMVSSPEDKAKRKELRDKVEHLITLALFKLPTLKENVEVIESLGQPFGSRYSSKVRDLDSLKQHLQFRGIDINDNKFIDLFMASLQDAFDMYASKVCYDAGLFKWASFWHIADVTEREQLHNQHAFDQQQKRLDMVADISPEGFKKSLTNMLLSACSIKVGSVKKPCGQFMPTLPVKWID